MDKLFHVLVLHGCMKNISFKASLKIDPSLYTKLPKETPSDFPEKLISEFREFLDLPKIKQATDGDIVELSRAKHTNGFALEMKFITNKLQAPFETGIYTNNKIPTINIKDLKYWTFMFLCHKQGEKPRMFESSFKMIERVLFNNQKIFRR